MRICGVLLCHALPTSLDRSKLLLLLSGHLVALTIVPCTAAQLSTPFSCMLLMSCAVVVMPNHLTCTIAACHMGAMLPTQARPWLMLVHMTVT